PLHSRAEGMSGPNGVTDEMGRAGPLPIQRSSQYSRLLPRMVPGTIVRTLRESFWAMPHDPRRTIAAVLPGTTGLYSQLSRSRRSPIGSTPFDRREFLFIHVPKTAGNSIIDALGIPAGLNVLINNRIHIHKTLRFYSLTCSKKDFDSYFKFAFVR